ncbi:response regulator [Candidatus Solincola sp.]|jgi:DNA-binding NarL/FixJ family response regulator|nr:response regulator transcription factor [Actinomycetota bacterium]MDI7251252.1 response regulator transcription factor [Actinomycetota bacterium]
MEGASGGGCGGRTRILVADDHRVIRAGLRRIMEGEEDLDLCGEAENAEELLRRVRGEKWDLLILDISLPDRSGLEVLEEVREMQPEMRVLVLSMHEDPLYVRRAFSLGASGYVSKDCTPEEVVEAVREVARGGRYLGRFLARRLGLKLEDFASEGGS